jgi:hypothetical protein
MQEILDLQCYEGEYRFSRLLGIDFRTLRRCRIRGIVTPDARIGQRIAYLTTEKRVAQIRRDVGDYLEKSK